MNKEPTAIPILIYVMLIQDRHTDEEVYTFTSSEVAVSEARKKAKELCDFSEDYEEDDCSKDQSWLFSARYSCNDDSIKVITTTLDGRTHRSSK